MGPVLSFRRLICSSHRSFSRVSPKVLNTPLVWPAQQLAVAVNYLSLLTPLPTSPHLYLRYVTASVAVIFGIVIPPTHSLSSHITTNLIPIITHHTRIAFQGLPNVALVMGLTEEPERCVVPLQRSFSPLVPPLPLLSALPLFLGPFVSFPNHLDPY